MNPSHLMKKPVNGRKLASYIDPGNEGTAEGNSSENEGDKKQPIVAQLSKTVEGVVELASRLIHVNVHRDKVENKKHDAED